MKKNILKSEICERLRVEYPIFLAGMGALPGMPKIGKYYTGTPVELVAAVSNAGGFGVLGAATMPPEEIAQAIEEIRNLTSKPFGIDFMFPAAIETTTQEMINREKEDLYVKHRDYFDWLDKIKEKFKLPSVELLEYVFNLWNPEFVKTQLEIAIGAKEVSAICSGIGTPKWVVERIHDAGKISISLIGSVHQAKRVAEMGADIIVAQGSEAGGHTGSVGTFALVPQVVDAVSPIPVLAAGGIGDGRGVAAAFCLGARGVWVGTAFLVSEESILTDIYKQVLLNSTDKSTVITDMFTGKRCRVQNNPLVDEWLAAGFKSLGMPLQIYFMSELMASAEKSGRPELFFLPSGQVAGMMKSVKSAKRIFDEMVSMAIKILRGTNIEGITVSEG